MGELINEVGGDSEVGRTQCCSDHNNAIVSFLVTRPFLLHLAFSTLPIICKLRATVRYFAPSSWYLHAGKTRSQA